MEVKPPRESVRMKDEGGLLRGGVWSWDELGRAGGEMGDKGQNKIEVSGF